MKCPKCNSTDLILNGKKRGKQQYKCKECGRWFQDGNIDGNTVIKHKHKSMGLSVNDFRKKHDVVYILSQVILKFDDETVYEKSDIITMANVSAGFPGLGTVLESEAWKPYSGRAGSKTWYGKPELITKLKNEGIMR